MREIGTTQTRLTPAQLDDLLARYEAGEGKVELAERFSIHPATVNKHILRHKGLRRGVSDEHAKRIVRLYTVEGMTMDEIGREVGLSQRSVGRVLVAAGVERRAPGRRRQAPVAS